MLENLKIWLITEVFGINIIKIKAEYVLRDLYGNNNLSPYIESMVKQELCKELVKKIDLHKDLNLKISHDPSTGDKYYTAYLSLLQ